MSLEVSATFAPARDSIHWAKHAIDEMHSAAQIFFQGDIKEIVTEFDANTGENVQKLRFRHPLPKDIRRKATEALNNIRHGFDQATYAAHTLTKEPIKPPIYFPWSTSPADLEGRLTKLQIDRRLWDIFHTHEPYGRAKTHTGGNDILRSLATLANTKHTVGLGINAHIDTTRFPTITGMAQSFRMAMPRWDPVKEEAELIRSIGNIKMNGDYQFRFQIVFKDPIFVHPVDAIAGLIAFHAKADAVVKDLQARCLDLCA